jgi:uncharacterized Fe-S cluster-containing protein
MLVGLNSTLKVYLIVLVAFFISCTSDYYSKSIKIEDKAFKGKIRVEKNDKIERYCLSIHNQLNGGKDRIFTPYRIFKLETGDIDGDGQTDICIGIVKPTPFDSTMRRRLFIFKIESDYIRPLWLGSRLICPLVNFKVVPRENGVSHVVAIEQEGRRFRVSEYQWGTFGLQLVKVHQSFLTFSQAKEIMNRE